MPALTARQLDRDMELGLASGSSVKARVGDWIIANGSLAIEVCPNKEFEHRFEAYDQGLVLPKATCTLLEEITGIGTTKDAGTLLKGVQRLAHIVIGDIRIDFTPGQLEEIAHRAMKRGFTVEQEIARIVERIKDEIFYKS